MSLASAKKPRLIDLGRDSHLTSRALCALLKQLNNHPLPDHFSRTTHRRHRQKIAYQATRGHGALLRTRELADIYGETMEFVFLHPFAWIGAACCESPGYCRIVRDTLDAHDPTS